MAGILSRLYFFMLFLCVCFPKTAPDRRFSDLKRCADEECSMLLCRGKAAKDFSAPDCRFLSFKKGETVYVYYKLAGQRSDLWAGSVGSNFGYFPKEFLDVNHIYTEKEVEVPSEETDFVCFDTGLDTFEIYDVDILLSKSLLLKEDDTSENSEEIDKSEDLAISADDDEKYQEESSKDSKEIAQTKEDGITVDDLLTQNESSEIIEAFEQSEDSAKDMEASLEKNTEDTPERGIKDFELFHKAGEADMTDEGEDLTDLEPAQLETAADNESVVVEAAVEIHQKSANSDPKQKVTNKMLHDSSIKDPILERTDSDHVSQVEAPPELKTTLGTTFDAVATDEANTQKVTPYFDEEINSSVDKQSEHEDEELKEFPLLSFEKELPNSEDNDLSLHESGDTDVPGGSAVETQKEEAKMSEESIEDKLPSGGDTENGIEKPDQSEDSDKDEEEESESEYSDKDEEEESESEDSDKDEEEEAVEEEVDDLGTDEPENVSKDKFKVNHSEPTDEKDINEHLNASSVTEEPILPEDKHIDVPEDTEILKPQNETVVIEHNKDLELSSISSDLGTPNDAVELEHDAPASIPENQVLENKSAETQSQTRESQKYEEDSKEDLQSAAKHDQGTDEQLGNVKSDPFKDDLKTEKSLSEIEKFDVYEENEEIEELLEDENAVLSTNAKATEKSEQPQEIEENSKPKAKLENKDLLDEQRKEEETKASIPSSLDHIPHREENDQQYSDASDEIQQDLVPSEEPEYSDSVQRLTILRDHFNDDEMKRIQKFLSLKDLFKVEAMFSDLEQELKSVRDSHSESPDDMERALESILEVSENSILNEIEKILDAREQKALELGQKMNPVMLDEEAAILDDFQELAFYLRQKYSAVTDSVPLVDENQHNFESENLNTPAEVEDLVKNISDTKASETPEVHEETKLSKVDIVDKSHSKDLGIEEDGGHFNKNKDVQAGFKDTEDVQRGPQAILENPVDIALSFDVDQSSDLLESQKTSDLYDSKADHDQVSTTASDNFWRLLAVGSELLGIYAEAMISALPEEWQPGPTFHGLPWGPVLATAAIGIFTVLMEIWRNVLTFKSKMYISNDKKLAKRSQELESENSDTLLKITELTNMIKELEEKVKKSEKTICSAQQEDEKLKAHCQVLRKQMEKLSTNISHLSQGISDIQEQNNSLKEKRVTMHEKIGEFQTTLKVCDDERIKFQVPTDEAKLREDALKAQILSLEKNNKALKGNQKSLLHDVKDWQEKHEKLKEEIKIFCKTQKEMEETLVHKENEMDVLSKCVADLKGLEACEKQKGSDKLTNGEALDNKGDPIKSHLKQIMDVSKIKTTLSIIEDERNRFWKNALAEQQARQEHEERFQQLTCDQTNLNIEKTRLEGQYKNLKQRLEITTELHQQKENTLQQKLTQEELERREKETKLSEVDDQALQAEEELKSLKQKVKDIQEEMQQTERALKAEIAVQEKKAHENSLKAHDLQRTLVEERRECLLLHEKIAEISDIKHSLYKSCPPDRHVPPRMRGDSYGPSPVNGGVPSPPPTMADGPDGSGSFLSSQVRDSHNPGLSDSPMAFSPHYMSGPLSSNGQRPPLIRPPNGHPLKTPPVLPLGPDPRFPGPLPPHFAPGRPLKNFPPGRPPAPLDDFPPQFDGPSGLPLTSQHPGPVPLMAPVPHGPVPHNSQVQGRENPSNSSSTRWPSPAGDCKVNNDQR